MKFFCLAMVLFFFSCGVQLKEKSNLTTPTNPKSNTGLSLQAKAQACSAGSGFFMSNFNFQPSDGTSDHVLKFTSLFWSLPIYGTLSSFSNNAIIAGSQLTATLDYLGTPSNPTFENIVTENFNNQFWIGTSFEQGISINVPFSMTPANNSIIRLHLSGILKADFEGTGTFKDFTINEDFTFSINDWSVASYNNGQVSNLQAYDGSGVDLCPDFFTPAVSVASKMYSSGTHEINIGGYLTGTFYPNFLQNLWSGGAISNVFDMGQTVMEMNISDSLGTTVVSSGVYPSTAVDVDYGYKWTGFSYGERYKVTLTLDVYDLGTSGHYPFQEIFYITPNADFSLNVEYPDGVNSVDYSASGNTDILYLLKTPFVLKQ